MKSMRSDTSSAGKGSRHGFWHSTSFNPEYQPSPTPSEAIGSVQSSSMFTILCPTITEGEARAIRRVAHRDARSSCFSVTPDGLVASPYLALLAHHAHDDITANIRDYLAETLPYVTEILRIARELSESRVEAPSNRGGAEKAPGPWDRTRESRQQAANAELSKLKASSRASLIRYLESYNTSQNMLVRRLDRCLGIYDETSLLYISELFTGHRRFVLPWRSGSSLVSTDFSRLHAPSVDIPELPTPVFRGMSVDEVIAHAREITLPVEYGGLNPEPVSMAAFAQSQQDSPATFVARWHRAKELMMTRSATTQRVLAVLFAVLLMCSLPGCGDKDAGSTDASSSGLTNAVLVIGSGVRANVLASSSLPAGTEEVLTESIESGGSLDVVTVEGTPTSFGMQKLGSTAQTAERRKSENSKTVGGILSLVSGSEVKATTSEADLLAAIELAGRELRSASTSDSTEVMVIEDSMLSTAGTVNFASGQISLLSDPSEIVAWLKSEGELPDLEGIRCFVYYCGDVDEPQSPLSGKDRENLEAIWSAILEAAGCESVEFRSDAPASSGSTTSGLPEVSTVEVDEPTGFSGKAAVASGSTVSLGTKDSVTFIGDTADFVDEQGALDTLGRLAQLILDNDARVAIEGNTAGDSGGEELSLARARRVADILLKQGVQESAIVSVTGNGCKGGPHSVHVPDTVDGVLVPALAEQNRSVVVAFL